MDHISYSLALAGGVISFVSPCVLPLVPPYLSYLAGVSFEEMNRGDNAHLTRRVVLAAFVFVLGFSTVFVASGAVVSSIGQIINEYRNWLNILAGSAIIIMGLHFLGVFKLALLHRQARFQVSVPIGLWGAYVMGLAFAFGWTPCIGPILAAILVVAGNEASVLYGAKLLAVYSMGLGFPFILSAFLIGPAMKVFTHMHRYMGWVEKLMGGLLILTGIMILFNWNNVIAIWILDTFPGIIDFEEGIFSSLGKAV